MALAAMRRAPIVIFTLMVLFAAAHARAESSKGENYSAGKTPQQLFNSDCTGSGCHAGPQGLARGKSPLAGSRWRTCILARSRNGMTLRLPRRTRG